MRELTAFEQMLAEECAARHRTPKATVTHPKGVIVPNNVLMTENIRDPDYVPYCGPCTLMQRVRRVEDGFKCPTCGNKSNWDLTKFNGNVDVQFDPELVDPVWLAQWQIKVEAIRRHEALHEQTYLAYKSQQTTPVPQRDWSEDKDKKNTSFHPCGKCKHPFFGKQKRKYCVPCQAIITEHLVETSNAPHAKSFYD
jgi:hypothetical protein